MTMDLNHPELFHSIKRMLQGVAYLLAYYDCVDGKGVSEREFVVDACNILRKDLGKKDYFVQMEYPYKKMPSTTHSKAEADIIIAARRNDTSGKLEKEPNPEDILCVFEFKMSSDTNGNVYKDAEKLRSISSKVDRFAIILFLKPNEPLRRVFVYRELNGKKCKPEDEKIELESGDKVNYKARRIPIDLYKIEREKKISSKNRRFNEELTKDYYLSKETIVSTKRVFKACSSTSNSHPYMAVCIAVHSTDYTQ